MNNISGRSVKDVLPGIAACLVSRAHRVRQLLAHRARKWCRARTQFPSCVFFTVGVLGMLLMIVFAVKLDSRDVRANWIEQMTNGIAQAAFFLGLLFL